MMGAVHTLAASFAPACVPLPQSANQNLPRPKMSQGALPRSEPSQLVYTIICHLSSTRKLVGALLALWFRSISRFR